MAVTLLPRAGKILSAALAVILSPFAALRAGSAMNLSAQVSDQSFQVIPEATRPAVGDSVTIRFRVRLDERDLLFDTIPQPVGALPAGVRVLSVEKMTRAPDRIFHGHARVAFYRPGRQPIPLFGLPFMRAVKGVQRATLLSDSAFVDITPVLPAGNPPLKDIKPLEQRAGPPLTAFALAGILAAGSGLYLLLSRRRRPARYPSCCEVELPAQPVEQSPYQVALERLTEVERDRWPARGKVATHYEAIVDVLRQYLEDAEQIGARERTTSELLWALPPHLSAAGLRDRCDEVLSEADLVKFARLQPGEASASQFLGRARALVKAWHEAVPLEEGVDALR